ISVEYCWRTTRVKVRTREWPGTVSIGYGDDASTRADSCGDRYENRGATDGSDRVIANGDCGRDSTQPARRSKPYRAMSRRDRDGVGGSHPPLPAAPLFDTVAVRTGRGGGSRYLPGCL